VAECAQAQKILKKRGPVTAALRVVCEEPPGKDDSQPSHTAALRGRSPTALFWGVAAQ
jgi:hypothetical protein